MVLFIKNKKTKTPLSVPVKLSAKLIRKSGKDLQSIIDRKSDKNGKLTILFNPALKQIKVNINEKGYLPYNALISPDLLTGN